MPSPSGRDTPTPHWGRVAAGWGGLGLHVLVGVFPFAVTGLLAPAWGVAILGVWWLVLAVAAWRLRRRSPWLVPLVPVAALAGWAGFLTFGDLVLGWTA